MSEYNLEELNILVVDDNRHMHEILRAILNAMRIKHIRYCDDPADAFAEMRAGAPDIIITDWKMDPLDGLDFTRRVRTAQDSPNPYVPIIMLTGYTERHRICEARDAGVNEFLKKPIAITGLRARIINIIENPRVFIETKSYFGPDRRRRRNDKNYNGPRRRADDEAVEGVTDFCDVAASAK